MSESDVNEPLTNVQSTTDHNIIRRWTEERNGTPARVRLLGDENQATKLGGLLRIDFWNGEDQNLEQISWEDFFTVLDFNNLVFLYQEKVGDIKSIYYSVLSAKENYAHPENPIEEAKDTANKEFTEEASELEDQAKDLKELS